MFKFQFDKKFNNEKLLKFLNKSQQEQAKIVNNEISPPCYPKSKKKNISKEDIGSKICVEE